MDKSLIVFTTTILILLIGMIAIATLAGCESVQERSVRYSGSCKASCEFQGAAMYSYNLGNERDCICTVRIRSR